MAMADKITRVITGAPPAPAAEPVPSGAFEGTVIAVSTAGLTFTINSWDESEYQFGPAPWTQVGVPVAGDRCLVVFADTEPWVIGWWPSG